MKTKSKASERFGWFAGELVWEDEEEQPVRERSSDDDHFYGAWTQGGGGRAAPTSAAQVQSASELKKKVAAGTPLTAQQIATVQKKARLAQEFAEPAGTAVQIPEREWQNPPPKRTKDGQRKAGGYSADEAYGTNTELGRVGEDKFTKIMRGRVLHPPGMGEQSPLDVKVDGYGFEVKAVSTKATGYKATPKKYEIAQKEEYAKQLGIKPALAIVVIDSATDTAYAYWRPGLQGGRLSSKTGWKYLGRMVGGEVREARSEDDDHFYGAWIKGGGRAPASARQGAAIARRDKYGRFVQQVGEFPADLVDPPRGENSAVVQALDTFPPDAVIRMYHGTTLSRAKSILRDGVIKTDDLNSVGLTSAYSDARKYGTYKAKPDDPAVTLEVAVKRSELGTTDPVRDPDPVWYDPTLNPNDRWLSEETGGSGMNSVLVYQLGKWPGVSLTGARIVRHHPASGGAKYFEARRSDDEDHFYGAWIKGGGRAPAPAKAIKPTKLTGPYHVEGWRGMENVGFRQLKQSRAVRTYADELLLDLGADRVLVRQKDAKGTDHLIATKDQMGWRGVKQSKLADELLRNEEIETAEAIAIQDEDDHFYGAWMRGGGRGAPRSAAGVKALSKRAQKKAGPYDDQAKPGAPWNPPPALRATSKEANAWRKAVAERYKTDSEFRAAVDAAMLYTQGDFDMVKAALKGKFPETWLLYHGKDAKLKELGFDNFTNPMADYTNYMTGLKKVSGREAFAGTPMSAHEAALALNKAVQQAPPATIYRGVQGYWRYNDKRMANEEILRKVDDRLFLDKEFKAQVAAMYPDIDPKFGVRDLARRYAREHEGYIDWTDLAFGSPEYKAFEERVPGIPIPKVGDTYDIDSPASFTHSFDTADKFSQGIDPGQGRKPKEFPAYSVIIEARSAPALNVGALSPWGQSEALTSGKFKVTAVQRQTEFNWQTGSYSWEDFTPTDQDLRYKYDRGTPNYVKIVLEPA